MCAVRRVLEKRGKERGRPRRFLDGEKKYNHESERLCAVVVLNGERAGERTELA